VTEASIDTLVIDLDGVLWRGMEPVPGASDALKDLIAAGLNVRFLTNNGQRTRESVLEKFIAVGMPEAPVETIYTSAYLTARYVKENLPDARTAFVIGCEGIREELKLIGVKLVEMEAERADLVVTSLDKSFTYEKLCAAQRLIGGGARFMATNADASFPAEGGQLHPGAGTMAAAVATAVGFSPLTIGKPNTICLETIFNIEGITTPEGVLVVGDRLNSDILLGRKVGCLTALVLTGISTAQEADELATEHRPHWIELDFPAVARRVLAARG